MGEPLEITVLLLGDAGVGKSTFLSRISRGKCNGVLLKESIELLQDSNQPFIFDISFKNSSYRLEFYDTSSPENWTALTPDVIVLCYDISSRLSLINLQRYWHKETRLVFSSKADLPILLLGLKRDLRSETDPNGVIYPQEGHRIAQEIRCDKYMECSATTGELLPEVFEDICRTAVMTTTSNGGLSEGACEIM
ncbi:P-loop containing nucleoside triphosphate hydrolase protein [Xylogone sp. PMI_703]|nr:P-loop containing nucleoside triphosphate hydrolase protein [Xylogone sp. PMI_703]